MQPRLFRPHQHAAFVLFQTRRLDIRRQVVVKIEPMLAGSVEIIDDNPRFRNGIQYAAAMNYAPRHPPVAIVLTFDITHAR